MRIEEPYLLNIRFLVRRNGRIKVVGNHVGIQQIRESKRFSLNMHVGKSELGEGLVLLWDVSNMESLGTVFLSVKAQPWIASSVGSQVIKLLNVRVILWLAIIMENRVTLVPSFKNQIRLSLEGNFLLCQDQNLLVLIDWFEVHVLSMVFLWFLLLTWVQRILLFFFIMLIGWI